MRFTNAYAQPLCSPTRASLLTGQYNTRHGITTASGHQPPQPEGHKFLPETAAPTQPMLTPQSKNYLDLSQIEPVSGPLDVKMEIAIPESLRTVTVTPDSVRIRGRVVELAGDR